MTTQRILNPIEWTERKCNPIWLHALDVMKHVLKGDYRLSAYKDPNPSHERLDGLRDAMETHTDKIDYLETLEDTFRKTDKTYTLESHVGELDIERYIEGSRKPFDEYRKKRDPKPAITLVMDINIPWHARHDDDMIERHKKIYTVALRAEAERQPCRVIGAKCLKIPELDEPLRYYLIIKDFTDPIFPGIWGAFKTNETNNDFTNCIGDYLIGTRHDGNGMNRSWDILNDIPEEECTVINPGMIHKGGN